MMDLEKGSTKYSNTITRWLLSKENRKLQIQNKQTKIFFTEYVTLPDVDHKILYQSKKKLHKFMKEKYNKGYLLLRKYKDTAFG